MQQLFSANRKGVIPGSAAGRFWWRDRARTQPWDPAVDLERSVEFVDCLTANPVGWQLGPNLWNNATIVTTGESQNLGGGRFRIYSSAGVVSTIATPPGTIAAKSSYWVSFYVESVTVAGSGITFMDAGTSTTSTVGWKALYLPANSANINTAAFLKRAAGATDVVVSNVTVKEILRDESWLGANLFTGGSFEVDLAGASGVRCDVARSTARAQSGTASLLCTVNNNTGASRAERSLMTVGRCYQVEAWVYLPSGQATTGLQLTQGGVTTGISGAFSNSVTNTWVRLQAVVGAIVTNIGVGTTGVGTIGDQYWVDDITVREIPGHPIVSAVSGSGLVGSKRVNLLQRTENFSASPWAPTGGGVGAVPTITNNFSVAPDGTTTAGRLQVSLNGGTTTADQSLLVQVATGVGLKGSWWVKTNDGSTKTIYLRGAVAVNVQVTGAWQQISFSAGDMGGTQFGIGLRGGQGSVNSNSADLLIWHPDLRHAFWDSFNLPAYQRVGDGTAGVFDYDDTGFPLHLKNVTGTQAMMTLGTVDMTAGDAGVLLANVIAFAADGIVAETSANASTNLGAAYVYINNANSRIDSLSRGSLVPSSARVTISLPSAIAARSTFDIGADLLTLEVNNLSPNTVTGDQGSGNLGNHRLNIAGRDVGGTASLRFTGYYIGNFPALVAGDAGIDTLALSRELAAQGGFKY